jgi:hypothetical protein
MRDYNMGTIPTYNTGKNVQLINGKVSEYSGLIPPLGVLSLVDLHLAMTKIDKIADKVRDLVTWCLNRGE